MVGAFAPRKDFKTYLQVAQQILAMREDVVFLAVGDGPLLDQSKRSVRPENRANIIFTGSISDVENVIQLFDIGVLFSNTQVHGEGISNAILEYMAAGKPVLANDNGGNAEIIVDGKTGFILSEDETQNWVDRLNYLLDHPVIAEEMGRRGEARVKSTFHIDQMIASFRRVYQDLFKTKQAYG
jgi:glycosyltransferase involved in cell wall biosynthesis